MILVSTISKIMLKLQDRGLLFWYTAKTQWKVTLLGVLISSFCNFNGELSNQKNNFCHFIHQDTNYLPKAQKNIKTNLKKKKNKDPWNKWTINSKSIITIIENLKHTHLRKSAFQTIGFLMKTKVHLTLTALNTQASNTEQLSFLRTIVILLSHLQWTKLKIS